MAESDNAHAGKMFGMPSVFIGTKAFAGYREGAMVFKLDGDAHAAALGLPGAHLFEPMEGRPMKEWVVVPAEHSADWARIGKQALEYVAAGAAAKPKKK
ncbi:MAG: TfoX/Sxy family protein [Candidatus Dormibacteraeota bacterium]|nr:TfoX/Sxy family protein [Candidatus Dormibacteraeota bacterium]